MQQNSESVGAMAAKAAPGVAVMGAGWTGYTIEQWVGILTVVYLLLMISNHVWRYWIRPYVVPRNARTRCTDTGKPAGADMDAERES